MFIIQKLFLLASLRWGHALSALSKPPLNAIVVDPGPKALQLAVDKLKNLKGDQHIFINPGVYPENVIIQYSKGGLIIEGATSNANSFASNMVVVASKISRKTVDHNNPTAAIVVKVDNFVMKNINVTNTFGNGAQALALAARGLQQVFKACSFEGFQDTLLLRSGAQYLDGCNIVGNDDFIFGNSRAYFEGCTIGVTPGPYGSQVITAHQRLNAIEGGIFVFNKCEIKPIGPVAANSTFLGRPWRTGAQVAFQFCRLPGIINSAGWKHFYADKDPLIATENPHFYEYQNIGDGADLKGRQLLSRPVKVFDRQSTLGTDPSVWRLQSNTVDAPEANPKALKASNSKPKRPGSPSPKPRRSLML